MKPLASLLFSLATLPALAQSGSMDSMQHADLAPAERLGTVSFPVSCSAAVQVPFNRGVALLHDFWYDEARVQFEQIVKTDPSCAMAHWGVAMSVFHQIWARPDEAATRTAWEAMQKAQSLPVKTGLERAYIAALSDFFRPGKEEFQGRIDAYSAAMANLYREHPDDVDAGAFYALSLLAAEKPDDTSLSAEHKAMAVLTPLFAKYPDNPGVVHYIIHACDNPTLAADGLAAADHYGEIAPSGAHAYHMPGHIYARLGMWPQDIAANLGSVTAAQNAEKRHESGLMDEPHSYDFLLYAYLQSGQDARAKWVLDQTATVLTNIAAMPNMGGHHMAGMVPYYRAKYPIFYALEMRNWPAAAALQPEAAAPPEVATETYWAHAVADGHLHRAKQAKVDLTTYDGLILLVKKGKHAYMAEGTGVTIERGEIAAWAAYADGKQDEALQQMRQAADLQDKVGQGEVDIPAREMLADMLLELHRPQEALVEYDRSLKLSPNRFNGLYNAGLAAEAAGEKAKAQSYYAALLKSTGNGAQSTRPEFAHLKSFASATQVAAK